MTSALQFLSKSMCHLLQVKCANGGGSTSANGSGSAKGGPASMEPPRSCHPEMEPLRDGVAVVQ